MLGGGRIDAAWRSRPHPGRGAGVQTHRLQPGGGEAARSWSSTGQHEVRGIDDLVFCTGRGTPHLRGNIRHRTSARQSTGRTQPSSRPGARRSPGALRTTRSGARTARSPTRPGRRPPTSWRRWATRPGRWRWRCTRKRWPAAATPVSLEGAAANRPTSSLRLAGRGLINPDEVSASIEAMRTQSLPLGSSISRAPPAGENVRSARNDLPADHARAQRRPTASRTSSLSRRTTPASGCCGVPACGRCRRGLRRSRSGGGGGRGDDSRLREQAHGRRPGREDGYGLRQRRVRDRLGSGNRSEPHQDRRLRRS